MLPFSDPGGEEMLEAAKAGNLETFEKAYQDRRPGTDINYADSNGQTSLYQAALYGHLQVVKFILRQTGTNVNQAQTTDGETRLV